jgi:hypothetical protein
MEWICGECGELISSAGKLWSAFWQIARHWRSVFGVTFCGSCWALVRRILRTGR